MSSRPGLWYYCGTCGEAVTDWTITRRPDGKLHMRARCCGHEATFVRAYDGQGLLFTDLTPGTEEYREEWERLVGQGEVASG
jgi:hypothetical protein